MFKDLVYDREVLTFLKNELKQEKKAGTYLFYGNRGSDLGGIVKNFVKGLNCSEVQDDFCGVCDSCKRIEKGIYPDIETVGLEQGESQLKIGKIKEAIYRASTSSYEGKKQVIIIKDIEKLNKYSGNAMLKIIEEPPQGTYFILISNTLNILPTILSRSIVIKVKTPSFLEQGVEEKVFDFFMGKVEDITQWKEKGVDLEGKESCRDLPFNLENYLERGRLEEKVKFLKSVEDYVEKSTTLSKLERVGMGMEVLKIVQKSEWGKEKSEERKILEYIFSVILIKGKKIEKMEELITLKQGIQRNVSLQLAITLFFLNS